MFKITRLIALTFLTAIIACSSTPEVTEFPMTADPAQEISHVDGAIKSAMDRQVNALSPRNFKSAVDTLDKAKQQRNENKDQKDVLHSIALAKTYLDKANAVASVSSQLIPGVIKTRKDAVTAQAAQFFPTEFAKADAGLSELAKDIEANDTSGAEKSRGELEARYSDLELQSIRQAKIGEARRNIRMALNEGAEKLVPQTLTWAEKRVNEDDAALSANRHNAAIVDKASADSIQSSARLLKMVRQAKSSSQQSPEQLASELEKGAIAVGAAETQLDKTATELESKKSDNAALKADNKDLEEKGQFEQQYEFARHQFTSQEAEVYKQGDKLLLRLKGLSFPKDQAVITTNNYPLLAKVQKVIKETAPGGIVIEGHTDSTGSKAKNEKLSADRASAVEGYLKANNFIESDKISASGFGDSKPIASNKTKNGRAQNRRVDVILNSSVTK